MLKGLKISTTNCGIKYSNRDDLLLMIFEKNTNVAGVFTQSSMPAAPVIWCKKNIKKASEKSSAKALIVNAGNANAFTGKEGQKAVLETAKQVAKFAKCLPQEVFISSTGVIGEPLKYKLITAAIPKMIDNAKNDEESWLSASKAIMTTDTKNKLIKKTCKIGDQKVSIIGFAKGSGMIAPNMATMLGYVFTDAKISSKIMNDLLKETVESTFNSITVDSDQSTNDTVLFFATNVVNNQKINSADDKIFADFKKTFFEVLLSLAKMIVVDGEGAKKLIEIEVGGAKNKKQAKEVAFAIANSPLVKTAIAGADPNWGRIVMAVGKSCKEAKPEKLEIKIGNQQLTKNGARNPNYVEKKAHEYLKNNQVKILVDLKIGKYSSLVWTCDLNEEYIKINKDYRS
jgi:glutamate N-acetyltransferase/amino-acid N-acetyltransferase